MLRKSGKEFHPIAIRTNTPHDGLEGTIFEITEDELLQTDQYEVSDYKRVLDTFDSGKMAWVYVAKTENQFDH